MKKILILVLVYIFIKQIAYAQYGSNLYYAEKERPYIGLPIEDIKEANRAMQSRYEQQRANEKAKALLQMQMIKDYYDLVKKYPEKINTGWHNVFVMNNVDFIGTRKVYVDGNRITKYVIDDWYEVQVTFSVAISAGKTMIKTVNGDATDGDLLDVYFIEDINDPNVYVWPPTKPGRVSFWTSMKNSGSMTLYFNGTYIGSFDKYFPEGNPVCGQEGTVTVTYKPGTYDFSASLTGTFTTRSWSGQVTITEEGCTLQGLSK